MRAVDESRGDRHADLFAMEKALPHCPILAGCIPFSCGSYEPATSDGPNTPLFLPVAIYDTRGLSALSVAVGDVNMDGKPDVVVANWGSGTVSVLLGNGDGTGANTVGVLLENGDGTSSQR